MRLNSNSISARLYRYFYGTKEMPVSLCNYFWALVIAYLLIIPLEIFGLVGTLILYKSKTFRKGIINKTPILKFGLSFLTLICCLAIYVMLIPFIHLLKIYNFKEADIFSGIVIDIVFLTVFIVIKFAGLIQKKFLVIEYAKSKIKNVCPKIDWDN